MRVTSEPDFTTTLVLNSHSNGAAVLTVDVSTWTRNVGDSRTSAVLCVENCL